MLPFEDARSLALLYHQNSEPWMNLAAYSAYHGPMAFKSVGPEDAAIDLPAPGGSPLSRLLAERSSCREFAGTAIPLSDLASLLHAGYGILRLRSWGAGHRTFQRPVPSAGGLYPLELYAVVSAVEGLARGVYHYAAARHWLEPLASNAGIAEFVPLMMNQAYLEDASVIILLSAVFSRTMRKYGPRGYRYILLEAGHVAQNLCLRAIELGLGSLCVGGYTDSALNRRLRLDGSDEAVVYGVAIGPRRPPGAGDGSAHTPVQERGA
jgi:SagB-type dehydrogenase family enzyme